MWVKAKKRGKDKEKRVNGAMFLTVGKMEREGPREVMDTRDSGAARGLVM
jgi:hypothetical protein